MWTHDPAPDCFDAVSALSVHCEVLEALLLHFNNDSRVTGAILSGSLATGRTDNASDLDVGILCRDEEARDALWEDRWDWDFLRWFHRFDADHIKPYFVIYFFEPGIKADVAFYTPDDLPPQAGGPFLVAWDADQVLTPWAKTMNEAEPDGPDWSDVVHEDERFWAWMLYGIAHLQRGEFYEVASVFPDLRQIVETWQARLEGKAAFSSRRIERDGSSAFLVSMSHCFPAPDSLELKAACQQLIQVQRDQRSRIDDLAHPDWTTTAEAIARVERMVFDLYRDDD